MSPLGIPSNREGLIQPSTTNQPPKFTPLTLESPFNPSTSINQNWNFAVKWWKLSETLQQKNMPIISSKGGGANVIEILHWYLKMQQRRWAKKTRKMPIPISGEAIPCEMQDLLLPQKTCKLRTHLPSKSCLRRWKKRGPTATQSGKAQIIQDFRNPNLGKILAIPCF